MTADRMGLGAARVQGKSGRIAHFQPRSRGRSFSLVCAVVLLISPSGGRAAGTEDFKSGLPVWLLGEWKALGAMGGRMIVRGVSVTFPDEVPEGLSSFRFRIARQEEGTVELENVSYAGPKSGGYLFWQFKQDGKFLGRARLQVSMGDIRGRNGEVEYHDITWYVRPK